MLDDKRGQWKMGQVFPGRCSIEAPDSKHMEVLVTALSGKDAAYWNDRRTAHPLVQPNLAWIEFAVANNPREAPLESTCPAVTFLT